MSANRDLYLFGKVDEVNSIELINQINEIVEEDLMIEKYNEKLSDENKEEFPPVQLTICSAGGNVYWGCAIINTLDELRGKLYTHAIGVCASMAFQIYLQGDVRTAKDLTTFGVHGTSVLSGTGGYVKEIQCNLEILNKLDNVLNKEIVNKTNISKEDMEQFKTCIKWYNYDEALKNKIINYDIYTMNDDKDSIDDSLDKE